MDTKKCKTCQEDLELNLFPCAKRKNNTKYYYPNCKKCYKDKKSEYQSNYYKRNIEKIKNYHSNRYKNNLEYEYTRQKKYRLKNAKLIKEKRNIYLKNKILTNFSFHLKKNISNSIRGALKKNNSSKKNLSCLKFLQYTIKELKAHLESKFELWMNWSNYGTYRKNTWNDDDQCTWTWQIDHIIPQSDLPYNSMEDENFKICWSLNNLRPLKSKVNCLEGVSKIRHKAKL